MTTSSFVVGNNKLNKKKEEDKFDVCTDNNDEL